MRLIAIDTASDSCSVAVWLDGHTAQLQDFTPRAHTRLILGMVDRLLQEYQIEPASLDAVAFGQGPGSFTGLRISCGVAQGLAFGYDIPVIPVSSLAAMAAQAMEQMPGHPVLVVNDARMGEVFWGGYARASIGNSLDVLQPETLSSPTQVQFQVENLIAAGSAWSVHAGELPTSIPQSRILDIQHAQARYIAELAAADTALENAIAAELAVPAYLRDQVIQNP